MYFINGLENSFSRKKQKNKNKTYPHKSLRLIIKIGSYFKSMRKHQDNQKRFINSSNQIKSVCNLLFPFIVNIAIFDKILIISLRPNQFHSDNKSIYHMFFWATTTSDVFVEYISSLDQPTSLKSVDFLLMWITLFRQTVKFLIGYFIKILKFLLFELTFSSKGEGLLVNAKWRIF